MAMKKCKECGEEISSSAKVCPKCGKKQKSKLGLIFIILIVLTIIIGISAGNNDTTETVDLSNIEYMSVTVDDLDNDLESNSAAAKNKYNNQYVEITGRLGTIDSDLKYISLLSTTDDWDINGVHCTIKSDEQKNTILNLTTNDTIIVKGKITDVGEVLGYYLDIIEITKE
jgi:hypothetical protein